MLVATINLQSYVYLSSSSPFVVRKWFFVFFCFFLLSFPKVLLLFNYVNIVSVTLPLIRFVSMSVLTIFRALLQRSCFDSAIGLCDCCCKAKWTMNHVLKTIQCLWHLLLVCFFFFVRSFLVAANRCYMPRKFPSITHVLMCAVVFR